MADDNGRYLFVTGLLDSKEVTIAALYAPNENQLPFLEDALSKLQDFCKGDIILGCDLNLSMDPEYDKT